MVSKKGGVVVVMSAMLLLAGCETTNPYTGQQEMNKTSKYAGIGALGCGLVGALASSKGDKNENALKAGAACAAVGAGVGMYMDKQNDKLRSQLQGTGVQVVQQGDTIQLIMPDVSFKTDSADISSNFYAPLNSVAVVLKEYDKTNVNVVGYTDSRGSDQHNQMLSQNRAQSVVSYLMSQGVIGNRLNAVGMGKANPIGDNTTAAGQAMNRRVVVTISPQPGAGQ
jgi:outer membrane protein OmpA-like peptidoglycan-associated protein